MLEENLSKELDFLVRNNVKIKNLDITPAGIASTNRQRLAVIEINKDDFLRLFSGDRCRRVEDRSLIIWERLGLDGVVFRCQEYKKPSSFIEDIVLK